MATNWPALQHIISLEGIEQIAALMPRTNTDLLQIDTMTASKVNQYGEQIMAVLEPFWTELDKREHSAIVSQLNSLQYQKPGPGPKKPRYPN